MYKGSRAMRGGVVGHFASGIEQTDSNAAGNENPMDGEEPQYRPPERVVIVPLAGPSKQGRAKRRAVFLTAPLLWSTIPVLRERRMPVDRLPEGIL